MFSTKLLSYLPKYLLNPIKRSTSSALFITGDKAHETFAVLTPHVDFDERLKNKSELVENLKARELNLNLDEIVSVWIFYKKFQAQKTGLENARSNIAKLIKALPPEKNQEQIEKLITHGRMIKDDLKTIKDNFYSVEENAMTKVLSVPNVIHERTPIIGPLVIYKIGETPRKKSGSNFQIAHNLDLVEFTDNSYFLKNDAALFELGSTFYIGEELLKKEYIEFSNSDFARSVIVEGCGFDYVDPNQVFTVNETDIGHKHDNSRLHLTGGSSLASFMAYHAKHTIFPSLLPLKYFTIGRKYSPIATQERTLLKVSQETAIDIFIATLDDLDKMDSEIDKIFKIVTDIYLSLGYHFRVCYLPAKDLNKWESLRVSIQMYSTHLEQYVEVGYFSVCDNYVSKRLLFNYGTGFDISFPRVISGTIFSVPKVLACVIENYEGNAILHDNIKKYVS